MSISTAAAPPPPDEPLPSDAVGAVLVQLRGLLDTVADAPVWSLDDNRLQARLAQGLAVKAGVDELIARLVGQVDDRDLAKTTGSSSTRAHLMATHRVSAGAAASMLTQASATTGRTETTRTAWAAGTIWADQAVAIASATAKLGLDVTDPAVQTGQQDLIMHAQRLSHTELQIAANRLVERVDPDNADRILGEQLQAAETRAMQHTTFRGRRGLDGIARFSGTMPNLAYDMLATALEAIASPRRSSHNRTGPATAADVAVIRPGVLGTAETDPMQLTYGQRLGQAFCELLEHLPTDKLPHHGAGNATIVVTIDNAVLASGVGQATLTTGTTISASQTRRLACNAGLLPLVLDADSAILDLGRTKRCFDHHQRIALAIRDRGCIFPGCDRPPAWTEAHHITTWQDGGPTDLANGCLLCSFHHHLIHQGHWAVVMAADGIPDIIPPPHIDPHRQPLRHQRFNRRE